MDFLWHKVSEDERERIKEQAGKIMGNFSKQLEKIKEEIGETASTSPASERQEGGQPLEIDKKIMFENAPNKKGDFIVAEKGEW